MSLSLVTWSVKSRLLVFRLLPSHHPLSSHGPNSQNAIMYFHSFHLFVFYSDSLCIFHYRSFVHVPVHLSYGTKFSPKQAAQKLNF